MNSPLYILSACLKYESILVHTTWEAEKGGLARIQGKPGLHLVQRQSGVQDEILCQ